MSILKRFTIKNLLLNKKRSIVTIIGIILSTALICATAGLVTSFQKTLINKEIDGEGSYHILLKDVPSKELDSILKNRYIGDSYKYSLMGYANLKGSKNQYKPYLKVLEFEDKALLNGGINLVKGRFPKSSNEVVISEHVLYNGRVNYKLGDKITLAIGNRYDLEGNEINFESLSYNDDDVIEENVVPKFTKTFTIVGVIKRPNYTYEGYADAGYTVITRLENQANKTYTVGLITDKVKNYDRLYKSITGVSSDKFHDDVKYGASVHRALLEYQGYGFGSSTLTTLVSLGFIVIVIIIISSVFSIKNSFSISVTERFKQYGMLRSVGATKKQIKRSVLFEGLCLGLVGIPLGILSGLLAVFILIKIVGLILEPSLNGITFAFYINWIPILLAALLGFATIMLSALIPACKAAKISPIEAIRSSNDVKLTKKKIKAPKLIRKLFGVGGVISYKSLKRSKKKYRTTVVSLVVSIAIFIGLSSFIDYGFKLSSISYKNLDYNVNIYSRANNGDFYNNFKTIASLDGVDKYNLSMVTYAELDKSYLTDFGLDSSGGNGVNVTIASLSDDEFSRYVKSLGGSVSDFEDKGILVDELMFYQDNKRREGNVLKLNAGDSIKVGDKSLQIAKRASKKPMGYEMSFSDGGYVFVSEKTIRSLSDKLYSGGLYIKASEPDELCHQIDELKRNNDSFNEIAYNNYDEYVRENDAMILVISIFLYGFIAVITLIGVTNIFNTITTNMALRRKEFAMLKSVGMTKKEFNRMIRLESVFYGVKSLIIGSIIGVLLSYFIHRAVVNTLETSYMFPYKSIVIAVIFVFLIVGLTMKYSIDKINKENIIETIRNDNI
ncbi:MAG: ABC transporter permease [Bacilli bacterium]|nr:ABC transporter permease [Bacilli bacterium]